MHIFYIYDVGATFIVARALGRHVFGLKGDQTLYVAHLSTLQQNVGNVVHFLVTLNPLANLFYTHWNHLIPRWLASLG